MALVKFYDMSVEKYNALVMKDADALYFLNDGSLYKGSLLMTNIKFVMGLPDSPQADTLYIDANSGVMKYYTGETYIDITYKIATSSTTGLVKSSANVNTVAVGTDGVMTVNNINISKLVQGDTTLILNGNFLK